MKRTYLPECCKIYSFLIAETEMYMANTQEKYLEIFNF